LIDHQGKQFNLLAAEAPHPLTDIATVAGHRFHQVVDSSLIEPLDLDRLKNWNRIEPTYTNSDGISSNGAKWGVPILMGAEVLVANTERTSGIDSWGAMFDPRYQGLTTYVVEDFLSCVMLYQGADGTFASYVDRPEDAQKAVNAARDLLIRTKSQVRKFYESGAELQQMLVNEDVVVAHGYAGSLAKLILGGAPVRFVVPKEGSYAFVYNLNVVRNGPNRDNAYRFLDALLAYPHIGTAMTRSAGFISTFIGAAEPLSPLERAALSIAPDALQRLHFFRFEGQKLSSQLLDRAVEEVKAA